MYHKKKDKRSMQSSQWIYEALRDLLNEKDYSKITVTDVVNKANIGRTTFYRNFESLDDVLEMKCSNSFYEFRKYCIDYYKDNINESKTFLRPFLKYWYNNSEIIELIIKAKRENILKEYLKKEVEFFINASSIINSPGICNHLNYFIEMRVANSISILTEWIKNDKDIEPDDLANIINLQFEKSIKCNILF